MFTGIIEEIGTISNIKRTANSRCLKISCKKILSPCKLGHSIAVNGVCLTVTKLGDDYFLADVMDATIKDTNISFLKANDKVNLEPALLLDKPLGGHIVSGHVDGIEKIIKITNNGIAIILTLSLKNKLAPLLIKKGSIAINGISLTIQDKQINSFTVSIIPHTYKNTNLAFLKIGSLVNIETDMIGKYILSQKHNQGITIDKLRKYGFYERMEI